MTRNPKLVAALAGLALAACKAPPPPSGPIPMAATVTTLAFDQDGALIVGLRDGNLLVLQGSSPMPLTKGPDAVVGVAPQDDGSLVVAFADGSVQRGRRNALVDVPAMRGGPGRAFALAADGAWTSLLVQTPDGQTEARLLRNGQALQTIGDLEEDPWTSVAIQAGTPHRLALGTSSNGVRSYDDSTIAEAGTPRNRVGNMPGTDETKWPARSLFVFYDRVLLGGGMQPVLRAFASRAGVDKDDPLVKDAKTPHVVKCMALDGARTTVVTAHMDGTVLVWHNPTPSGALARTGWQLSPQRFAGDAVRAVAIDRDARVLAIARGDRVELHLVPRP